MIATSTKAALAAACALALTGCSSDSGNTAPTAKNFAKRVTVAPHLRLFIQCTESGSVVVADNGLGIPTQAWTGVRQQVHHVRVVALDSRHVIQDDQPGLVATAIDEAASSFSKKGGFDVRLPSRPTTARCVR